MVVLTHPTVHLGGRSRRAVDEHRTALADAFETEGEERETPAPSGPSRTVLSPPRAAAAQLNRRMSSTDSLFWTT